MAKAAKHSEMAKEIKKEYLLQHLDEVKTLITNWISQLGAPNPLAPREGIWGWLSVYRPALEEDPDSNHMLRQHVRSRALLRHHAGWEHKLDSIWSLINEVRKRASDKHAEQSVKEQRKYSENYLGVALWAAFDSACTGKPLKIRYKVPDDERGVACGDYKIELATATVEERSLIQKEHQDFTYYVSGLKDMKDLTDLWGEVQRLQEHMQVLASKALKSNDILYPCRFCRHLWK